jgi:hypothetical protein
LFIAGVTGVLLASCAAPPSRGDNVAQINEAPLPSADASLLQGYISQTRVAGATVCYDMDLNEACDFGEAFATSTANGSYTLTLDGFQQTQNYQLLATGGTAKSITSTAETVGVMLAPRAAKNITPLTTMVALDSDLAAKIGQTLTFNGTNYSDSYDVDIAKSGGTYGEHLALAKAVEVYMYILGRENTAFAASSGLTLNTTTQYIAALQDLATQLDLLTSNQIFVTTNVATAVRNAVNNQFGGAPPANLLDHVEGAVTAVMNEISTGTGLKQTEESIISACSSAFAATDLVVNWLQ